MIGPAGYDRASAKRNVAAMPKNPEDTPRLRQATWEMYSTYAERPLDHVDGRRIGGVTHFRLC